jgi:hypothetical protein
VGHIDSALTSLHDELATFSADSDDPAETANGWTGKSA